MHEKMELPLEQMRRTAKEFLQKIRHVNMTINFKPVTNGNLHGATKQIRNWDPQRSQGSVVNFATCRHTFVEIGEMSHFRSADDISSVRREYSVRREMSNQGFPDLAVLGLECRARLLMKLANSAI